MKNLYSLLRLSYGQQLFVLATLPLILAVAAIAILVAVQSRALAEKEIQSLEIQLIEAKPKLDQRNKYLLSLQKRGIIKEVFHLINYD